MTRHVFRLLVLAVLLGPALTPGPARAEDRAAAVVLMYHRFGEDTLPTTNIRMAQFRDHLEALKDGDFTVLPLPEVVDALRTGPPLPDKTVAITVDDAFASAHDRAWPLLREAGFPMTLFVSTETVGAPGYMTWDDIREMAEAGVTIGAHSHTHPHLPALTPEAQKQDMDTSLALFEQHLGRRPTLFAYPYGEADAAAMALVREDGFLAAFGQHSGVATGSDLFYLPRFALNEHYGASDRFRRVAQALPIPANDISPADPTLRGSDNNPPRFGFTVTDASLVPRLDRLTCFGPNGDRAQTEILGPRVEIRLASAIPPGRGRINCTLPAGGADAGRWYWRGTQFTVPGGED